MTEKQRFITLAIHTCDHAMRLRDILEREGIDVSLSNVNLDSPHVSAGIRVRIPESELPKALRIIENPEIFCPPESGPFTDAGVPPLVIVPTDFSPQSHEALHAAFAMAAIHHASVLVVHAFMTSADVRPVELSDSLDFDDEEINLEVAAKTQEDTLALMSRYAEKLRTEMKHGRLAVAPFETAIRDGLPEEVVVSFAKERHPLMIVMGTRGAGNKEPRIMGSVTAEVLDSCRYPVFTIPDSALPVTDPSSIGHVLFFTSPDQQDIVAIDTFLRLLPSRPMSVTLVCIPGVTFKESARQNGEAALSTLLDYCRLHYPEVTFDGRAVKRDNIEADMREIAAKSKINLLGVPNKKKNLLARFFNPTLAHRLLFITDYPMMVIPV